MRRTLWILAPSLLIILGGKLFLDWAEPQLNAWLIRQVDNFSKQHTELEVSVANFDLQFFPPELIAKQPQGSYAAQNADSQLFGAEEVRVRLDLGALLVGRLQISQLQLNKPKVAIDLDQLLDFSAESKPLPINELFKLLPKIPVQQLLVLGGEVAIKSQALQLAISVAEFGALLDLGSKALGLRLDIAEAHVQHRQLVTPVRGQLEVNLSEQGLDIVDANVNLRGQQARLRGSFQDLPLLFMQPTGRLRLDWEGNLGGLNFGVPGLDGDTIINGEVELKKGRLEAGGFEAHAKDLRFRNLHIQQITSLAQILPERVLFQKLAVETNKNTIEAQDFVIQFDSTLSFAGQVLAKQIHLQRLLQDIGVGLIPVQLNLGTHLNCEGELLPKPYVNCHGEATGQGLDVRPSLATNASPIVQINDFKARGEVKVDSSEVQFTAVVNIGKYEGETTGKVAYQDGFKINYKTEQVDLGLIKDLAQLQLRGLSRIEGYTEGHSKSATFFMHTETTQAEIAEFALGDIAFNLNYEQGLLKFSDATGTIGGSTYQGHLNIDLRSNQLVLAANSEQLQLQDVFKVLGKKITLPFPLTGTGTGSVTLNGPLKVNELTYEGRAFFDTIEIAGETFTDNRFLAHSKEGHFQLAEARLMKRSREIQVRGEGSPNGDIAFGLNVQRLPLEFLENVNLLNENTSGLLSLDIKVDNKFSQPHLFIAAQTEQVFVGEHRIDDAKGSVKITPARLTTELKTFGEELQLKIESPLGEQTDPFLFELITKNWNFTNLFALIGSGQLLPEYRASVTGQLRLTSDQGGFWTSSGDGTLTAIALERGANFLRNPKPIQILARNGVFQFSDFVLTGDQGQLKLMTNGFSRNSLDLDLASQIDIRLLQLFFPFLEDLSGRANLTAQVRGSVGKPELFGQAGLSSGFIKAKDFPHPFERINGQVQFSQSRILIQSLDADLAEGRVQVSGNAEIRGPRQIPTDVRIRLRGTRLQLPKDITTFGEADLTLTGEWFPLTLAGLYRVRGGLVAMEFTDTGPTLRKGSPYLPQVILRRAFEPIRLDLRVQIENPLPVKNSLFEGKLTGQLAVSGTPTNPSLVGRIEALKGAQILIRDRTFTVNNATVNFNSPEEINPELFITAQTRVSEYDINLLVQGKAKSANMRMNSLPPLEEPDIISLLALGLTTKAQEQRGSLREQESEGAYQIGAAVLQQIPLFQKAQKATGFSFNFGSEYDDTKNVEVRRYTMSRSLSERLKFSATRLAGEEVSDQFKLQYLLNPNVSAIGSFERKEATGTNLPSTQNREEGIFGADIEFRREFR